MGSCNKLNFLLFFLTILTTTAAGAFYNGANPFKGLSLFLKGIPFSVTLMAILLAHEMGHYITSKKHKVRVSLPYFIPAPPPPIFPFIIGTFGAFIKMQSPMKDRKSLLDVGVAGPLIGVIISIPALIIGLRLSEIKIMPELKGAMLLGESILFNLLAKITLGNLPEHHHIVLHPIAFAGWIGLLVTSLNLIPIGQLDGGHIAYALLGDKWYGKVCKFTFAILLVFGSLGLLESSGLLRFPGWPGWLIWAALLYILGLKHPQPQDFWTPLDRTRKGLGILAMLVFFLTFTPIPIAIS